MTDNIEQKTAVEKAPPITLENAQAHGQMYKDLMVLLTKKTNDAPSSAKARELLHLLNRDTQFRELYRGALKKVTVALEQQQRIFDQANEVLGNTDTLKTIIESLTNGLPPYEDLRMRNELLQEDFQKNPSAFQLLQLAPGLYEVTLPSNLMGRLTGTDRSQATSRKVLLKQSAQDATFVSVLFVPKGENPHDQNDDPDEWKGWNEWKERIEQHEVHHALWEILESADNVIPPVDVNVDFEAMEPRYKIFAPVKSIKEDLPWAFSRFRNELVAYLLSGKYGQVLPEKRHLEDALTYLKKGYAKVDINRMAESAYDVIEAGVKDVFDLTNDPDSHLMFIYPAMKARSFEELKKMFTTLVEETKQKYANSSTPGTAP